LEDRLRRHNSAHRGYTAIAQDWIIVYQEAFASNSEALKREKEIKSKKSRKHMKRYYVYIIYSESVDRYYIGSSSDLEDRLRRHNSAHRGFTGIAQDWIIVYREAFASNSEALKREKKDPDPCYLT
jgi:putative endonuclease